MNTVVRKPICGALAARTATWLAYLAASLVVAHSAALVAKESPLPEVSPEGLQLQKGTKLRAVYLKLGVIFDQFDRVMIVDVFVQFDKDWERDYNSDVVALGRRVTPDDMERIKRDLAAEFKKVFTKELQDKGGYAIVDMPAADVLILKPALINLRVNAPDLKTADMSRTVVSSAGQMTLYLELWDPTNNILARAIDPQADQGMGGQMGNSVENAAAADRILHEWAARLRKRLDAVHGKGK